MADSFVSAALAALNDSSELRDVAWLSVDRAVNVPVADRAPVSAQTQSTENRFAAAVCSGMAKSRLNDSIRQGMTFGAISFSWILRPSRADLPARCGVHAIHFVS